MYGSLIKEVSDYLKSRGYTNEEVYVFQGKQNVMVRVEFRQAIMKRTRNYYPSKLEAGRIIELLKEDGI